MLLLDCLQFILILTHLVTHVFYISLNRILYKFSQNTSRAKVAYKLVYRFHQNTQVFNVQNKFANKHSKIEEKIYSSVHCNRSVIE
jgi:ribosomal protein S24E